MAENKQQQQAWCYSLKPCIWLSDKRKKVDTAAAQAHKRVRSCTHKTSSDNGVEVDAKYETTCPSFVEPAPNNYFLPSQQSTFVSTFFYRFSSLPFFSHKICSYGAWPAAAVGKWGSSVSTYVPDPTYSFPSFFTTDFHSDALTTRPHRNELFFNNKVCKLYFRFSHCRRYFHRSSLDSKSWSLMSTPYFFQSRLFSTPTSQI